VSSPSPGLIGERVQPPADSSRTVNPSYFVDNGCLGLLVLLELYPDQDGPDPSFCFAP